MDVITFHSHDFRLLNVQVAAMRRYLPVERISVIVGPYGANPATSAGDVRLRADAGELLGVEVHEAPAELLGLTGATRLRALIESQHPSDHERLICHGDLFPSRSMTAAELLDGRCAAGRVQGLPGRQRLTLTWIALAGGASLPPLMAPIDPAKVRGWSSERQDDELRMELCEPGFLHADKLGMATWPHLAAMFARKVERIAQTVGAEAIDLGEKVAGLPDHAPRRPTPQRNAEAIPEGYTGQWWLDSGGTEGCVCG